MNIAVTNVYSSKYAIAIARLHRDSFLNAIDAMRKVRSHSRGRPSRHAKQRDFVLRINPRGELPARRYVPGRRVASRQRKCDVGARSSGPRAARRIAQRADGTRARVRTRSSISLHYFSLSSRRSRKIRRYRREKERGDKISSEMSIDNDDEGGEIPRGRRKLPEARAVGRDASSNANNNNGDNNGRILIACDSVNDERLI